LRAAVVLMVGAVPAIASAQAIYVADANGFTSSTAGSVGQFNLNGSVVNASLITGIGAPFGLAVTSTDVYYTDNNNGVVGDYSTATMGLNSSLIAISEPTGIAVSSPLIYVASDADNTVKEYDTGGTPLSTSFITGLNGPRQIALSPSGTLLFVANNGNGTVGEYSATTGSPVSPMLLSGLNGVTSVAVSPNGLDLYVGTDGNSTVGEYSIATGMPVIASLITGVVPEYLQVFGSSLYVDDFSGNIDQFSLSGPALNVPLISNLNDPLSFGVIPEPATAALLATAAGGLVALRPRRCTAPI